MTINPYPIWVLVSCSHVFNGSLGFMLIPVLLSVFDDKKNCCFFGFCFVCLIDWEVGFFFCTV